MLSCSVLTLGNSLFKVKTLKIAFRKVGTYSAVANFSRNLICVVFTRRLTVNKGSYDSVESGFATTYLTIARIVARQR